MPGMRRDPNLVRIRRFTPENIAALRARVESSPKLQKRAALLQEFLTQRERHVLRTGQQIGILPQDLVSPGPSHEMEFGQVAYWLNYPVNDSMAAVAEAWKNIAGALPRTLLDPTTFRRLQALPEFVLSVGEDGSIYGDGTYELLDPAGISIFAEYIWHYFWEDFAPFASKSVIVSLQGSELQEVKIALVGDWGTGPYSPGGPAAEVMMQAQKQNPDYIIHLGDVYYSGTQDEEPNNLLAAWAGARGKSFTLNSNHEMYDGGYGYFQTALGSTMFAGQRGASYFALQYSDAAHGGPWTLLALDSAYWSTSPMVIDGSICEPVSSPPGADAQRQFIYQLRLSPEKVIVLTHHNPISYDGATVIDDGNGNSLWSQVTGVLGDPAAWYWGHIHNGIVYTMPTVASNFTLGRCLGHGAIPFGPAFGLAKAQNPTPPSRKRVDWYAN